MTKEKLIKLLTKMADATGKDPERYHLVAEKALLAYVNDPEIKEAWGDAAQFFWYS
jgi:hypothetical protein